MTGSQAAANGRVDSSFAPPGGYGLMMVMAWLGKSSAKPVPAAIVAAAVPIKKLRRSMVFLPLGRLLLSRAGSVWADRIDGAVRRQPRAEVARCAQSSPCQAMPAARGPGSTPCFGLDLRQPGQQLERVVALDGAPFGRSPAVECFEAGDEIAHV